MSVVREFMSTDCQCIEEDKTLQDAAMLMRDLDCGSLPICGRDGKLTGFITDRDIVVKCLAEGKDAREVRAGDLATGKPHWVDADANVDDAIAMMEEHQVRRLPVISDHKLVGIISQGDIARHHYAEDRLGEMVEHISAKEHMAH
ncbi:MULTISPECIES: CBS domain-containing protein [Micrococcaceae]|uniref:CBS domain-containing protein n=1 Tax=Micrococcaceae TaxID=1268 RepID=UPI001F387DC9|nr:MULTISPECIES: CBS domain-containing protein [Micrococcaceae]MCF3139067.1 CBS domain-containing protein [Paenarthrobacter sp. AR 02]MCR1160820.1 CBS domain-containing protein [Paenarthrobacter sp. UW852]